MPADSGGVRAFNTLSPVVDERKRRLRLRLLLVSRVAALGGAVAELRFIHYARWTVIKTLPAADGSGARTPLQSSYLLFDTNFDGATAAYLDAFSGTVPRRLLKLWGTCVLFDETVGTDLEVPVPPGRFRRYVARNMVEVLQFYAAYGHASVVTVQQAIAVGDRARRAGRRGVSRARRDAAARAILPLVLGPMPAPSSPLTSLRQAVGAQWRAATQRFGVAPLTLVVPVAHDDLADRIRSWTREQSPLEDLPDTHFARITLLPHTLMDLGQAVPDIRPCDYLLFTSQYLGSRTRYLETLADRLQAVWRGCAPANVDKDAAWLKRHAFGTDYFVSGYPSRPVDTVRRDLRLRARLAELAHDRDPSEPVTWRWVEDARTP